MATPPCDLSQPPRPAAIIGGGPAGLMAATMLADAGRRVVVYDAMPSPGRKFLLAGKGGLNLTHSEPLAAFTARYGDRAGIFAGLLAEFGPDAVRTWAAGLGIDTFVGSSGRVFPAEFKAAPLLRAWLRRLRERGVTVATRHRWRGWGPGGTLLFDTPAGQGALPRPPALVLALGGASWPGLGSDGAWTELMAGQGVRVAPLVPANCGFDVGWSAHVAERCQGLPLKTVVLRFAGRGVRGDLIITAGGIEGGAVYALSAALREAIAATGRALLEIDLKPDLDQAEVARRLSAPRRRASLSGWLRRALALPEAAPPLLRELAPPEALADPARLAGLIKALPLTLTAPRPLAEAISTAGGVAFDEVDDTLMLRRLPGVFVAGEMLDWEAPTGGYLLTGCLSTGARAGRGAAEWVRRIHAP